MGELLLLAPFRPEHLERIRAAADGNWIVRQTPQGLAGEALREALTAAEIIIGEPDPALLGDCPALRWVQLTWAGVDRYTRDGVRFPEGVRLTNASGAFGHIVSQYALGQVLALMQNFPAYAANQRERRWRNQGSVATLDGATVLIFGVGNIGSCTARRLAGFDVRRVGVCRRPERPRVGFEELCTLEQAEDWLGRADAVICAMPENDATRHYLNRERLGKLKPGAVLVNVGRGSFVDALALAELLAAGKLRGAALDVTEPEPLPEDHPLWREPRCVITPHAAGGSFGHCPETEEQLCALCCENLRRWQAGEPLWNQVL